MSKPSGTGESHSSGGTGEGAKTSGGGGTKTHRQTQGQSEEQQGQSSHQKSQTHQAHHQRGSHLNKVGKSKSQVCEFDTSYSGLFAYELYCKLYATTLCSSNTLVHLHMNYTLYS